MPGMQSSSIFELFCRVNALPFKTYIIIVTCKAPHDSFSHVNAHAQCTSLGLQAIQDDRSGRKNGRDGAGGSQWVELCGQLGRDDRISHTWIRSVEDRLDHQGECHNGRVSSIASLLLFYGV